MKITLYIPNDFSVEFNRDRFTDTFERVICDMEERFKNKEFVLAGNYEKETLEMLKYAFKNSKIVNRLHFGEAFSEDLDACSYWQEKE